MNTTTKMTKSKKIQMNKLKKTQLKNAKILAYKYCQQYMIWCEYCGSWIAEKQEGLVNDCEWCEDNFAEGNYYDDSNYKKQNLIRNKKKQAFIYCSQYMNYCVKHKHWYGINADCEGCEEYQRLWDKQYNEIPVVRMDNEIKQLKEEKEKLKEYKKNNEDYMKLYRINIKKLHDYPILQSCYSTIYEENKKLKEKLKEKLDDWNSL